jgi:hypothetical protein
MVIMDFLALRCNMFCKQMGPVTTILALFANMMLVYYIPIVGFE